MMSGFFRNKLQTQIHPSDITWGEEKWGEARCIASTAAKPSTYPMTKCKRGLFEQNPEHKPNTHKGVSAATVLGTYPSIDCAHGVTIHLKVFCPILLQELCHVHEVGHIIPATQQSFGVGRFAQQFWRNTSSHVLHVARIGPQPVCNLTIVKATTITKVIVC